MRPRIDSKVIAEASGAFVNVITWAADSEEFYRKATELMDHLHLDLLSVEKPEPVANRGSEEVLGAEIINIVDEIRNNKDAIRYISFHTWREPIQ